MRISDWSSDVCSSDLAGYHAGIVVRNALFKLPARVDYRALPRVTFTDPEIAHVGLTETEARERHGDKVRALTWAFAENDRAQRSEEHTSELQSLMRISYAVFCLKKKKHIKTN